MLPQPGAMVLSRPAALSCAVPTTCLEVGYNRDRVPVKGTFPNQPLAELFNGKSWTRLSVPAPAGAADTEFAAISCLSATRCVAVGETDYGSPPNYSGTPLTGFWNGKSWRLVPGSSSRSFDGCAALASAGPGQRRAQSSPRRPRRCRPPGTWSSPPHITLFHAAYPRHRKMLPGNAVRATLRRCARHTPRCALVRGR